MKATLRSTGQGQINIPIKYWDSLGWELNDKVTIKTDAEQKYIIITNHNLEI